MNRPISHMMTKTIWTVDTEDTVEKVDTVLTSHRLSAVPVVDAEGVIFGIISTVDLLLFHMANKNPKNVHAWEVCSYKPITVSPDTSSTDVANIMIKQRVHHILIVENGKLVGIVSALDFVKKNTLEVVTQL